MTRRVSASSATMMPCAKPAEVCIALDPRTNACRITDAGIINLKRCQINALLQTELNMSMMEFETRLLATFDRQGRI